MDGSHMDVKTQEFLMGHILPGSQDNYYDASKVEDMRTLYSNLKWGRTVIENRFKLLRAVVARAFEGTDVDPDQLIMDYVAAKKRDATSNRMNSVLTVQPVASGASKDAT